MDATGDQLEAHGRFPRDGQPARQLVPAVPALDVVSPRAGRSFVSEQSQPGAGEGSQPGSDVVALTRSPGFWVIMRYAALFGVVLAFAALAFLGLVKGGTNLWFTLPKTRAGWTGICGGWE